ncbi:hypothetical protein ACFR9U_00545 [Halorientalis brevis]|uniref:RING-type E3 ubiquitin transferase n=1 Tax=Halorientalis brevis TaxID=1126241 RepID=A0ABD6C6V6_9EURY|nr:hypothetical protein [Halorientalis brevis]
MTSVNAILVGSIAVVVGVGALVQARAPYGRFKTIAQLLTTTEQKLAPGAETIVRRRTRVRDQATPERTPPEPIDGAAPALWAWRVRRKRDDDAADGSRWTTVESGLAVGDFEFTDEWGPVRFDESWVSTDLAESLERIDDPFEASDLELGTPDVDRPLGEPGLLTRLSEHLGLTGEDGLLAGLELGRRLGLESETPDRYQATIVRDGERLLLRGEIARTDDGLVVRDTTEMPLVVANGALEDGGRRLQFRARTQAVAGAALVLLGGAVAAGLFL